MARGPSPEIWRKIPEKAKPLQESSARFLEKGCASPGIWRQIPGEGTVCGIKTR